jgi:hypothetical protein
MLGKLAMLPLLSPILCLHGSDPTLRRFQRGQGVQGFAAAQRVGTPTSKHNDVIALPTFPSSRCSELDRGDNRGHSGDVELRVALHGS